MPNDIQFDSSKLDRFVENLGTFSERSLDAGRVELEKQMRLTRIRIVNQQLSGQTLLVRSGNLRRSGASSATLSGNELTGVVSFTALYARVQEFGADIKPGAGKKYLTIPLASAMTDRGVSRGPIGSFPDIVFKRLKQPIVDPFSGREIPAGALVAFQEKRKSQGKSKGRQFKKEETGYGVVKYDPLEDQIKTGELVPLFWLVKHVTIKPKHFVGNQLRKDAQGIGTSVRGAMVKDFIRSRN